MSTFSTVRLLFGRIPESLSLHNLHMMAFLSLVNLRALNKRRGGRSMPFASIHLAFQVKERGVHL